MAEVDWVPLIEMLRCITSLWEEKEDLLVTAEALEEVPEVLAVLELWAPSDELEKAVVEPEAAPGATIALPGAAGAVGKKYESVMEEATCFWAAELKAVDAAAKVGEERVASIIKKATGFWAAKLKAVDAAPLMNQ